MLVLKLGSQGSAVELVQLALKRSGYYALGIDGIYGAGTQNAVRRFQASYALIPDGEVGSLTQKKLEPYLKGYFITTVRSGDTLFRLAKRYGTTLRAIQAANPMISGDELIIGEKLVVPYGFNAVPTDMRYSKELVAIVLDALKARYPFIKEETYGHSLMGTPLKAIRIGNGKKQVLFNASHHANEWITTPLVLKFIEEYLKAYINKTTIYGRNAREMFEHVELFAAPLVNPDGVSLVNGALDAEDPYYIEARRIAAAYPFVRFPQGWKANIGGADLNLNYPADWDEAKRIKFQLGYKKPAPRDYVGEAPLSAPESRALYEYTRAHDFKLTLSYHTQGEEIYWKFKDIEPDGGYEIGVEMAQVSGYSLAEVPFESANAGYKDWFINEYKLPGYTVEAGRGENPLPLTMFDSIYSDNIGIMITALERA